uniref:Uncharacterized protein n=1 Tax=Setaria digitata TaxID=48799 RepID=A0A915PSH1_9BILA
MRNFSTTDFKRMKVMKHRYAQGQLDGLATSRDSDGDIAAGRGTRYREVIKLFNLRDEDESSLHQTEECAF